jgi:transposase-like protein
MRRSRFYEEQIVAALKEHEAGGDDKGVAPKVGDHHETLYNWMQVWRNAGERRTSVQRRSKR